jgi:hypothetical protein
MLYLALNKISIPCTPVFYPSIDLQGRSGWLVHLFSSLGVRDASLTIGTIACKTGIVKDKPSVIVQDLRKSLTTILLL